MRKSWLPSSQRVQSRKVFDNVQHTNAFSMFFIPYFLGVYKCFDNSKKGKHSYHFFCAFHLFHMYVIFDMYVIFVSNITFCWESGG